MKTNFKEMKTGLRNLGILVVSIIAFSSCKSDDDSPEVSADLLGTWNIESLDYTGSSSSSIQGISFKMDFVGVGENIKSAITFTDNPNELSGAGSYDIKLTITLGDNSTTETTPVSASESVATWERNGDILTTKNELFSVPDSFSTPGISLSVEDLTIEELTDTTLRLFSTTTKNVTQDGIISVITVSSTITLTRGK